MIIVKIFLYFLVFGIIMIIVGLFDHEYWSERSIKKANNRQDKEDKQYIEKCNIMERWEELINDTN